MADKKRSVASGLAMACTAVYFASYVMRLNFTVMIAKICSDMQLEKSDLAIVITGLTVVYGAGQIINGFIGDKVKPRYMLATGLALAAAANIAMFFASEVPVMTAIWCVNGFAHSMLWPPIVRIMSTHMNDEEYGKASVKVQGGSAVATVLLYLVCPLLIGPAVGMSWHAVMLVCAAVGLIVMTVWLIVSPKIIADGTPAPEKTKPDKTEDSEKESPKARLPRYVFVPVALIMVGIIMMGGLRDGVTAWMPSFLNETFGIPEEMAIISTVVQAIFGVFSFWAFNILHRKVFKNEVVCAAVTFGLATLSALGLYLSHVLSAPMAVSLILMSLIIACMYGVNLMLISIVPKRFLRSGKVSTYSGILNACTYVGSAVFTPVFAIVTEENNNEWGGTILLWTALAAAGIVLCISAVPLWKRFRRDYAGEDVKTDQTPSGEKTT